MSPIYLFEVVFRSSHSLVAFIGTASELAKWLMLSFGLLSASVFLSVGQVLSRERRWMREVGIVLLSTAAFSVLMMLMMALMFLDPDFQKAVSREKL